MYKPLEMELLADGDDDHDDVDCLNVCVCVKVSALHVCKNAFATTDISLPFWLGAAGMCGFCSGKE